MSTSVQSAEHDPLPAVGYRRYVLGLLAVVYVFNFTDRQILAILLQPIKVELLLSDTQLGLISGIAFALFYATLGIPIARMADRYSRVNIISISIFLWSLMTALSGMAANFTQLLLARIGVGVGEAGCTPPAHSLLSDYYAKENRASALSVYSLGLPIGSFLGLFAGGWVAQLYGWRAAFFIVGLPGLILAVLVKLTIREPARGLADGKASADRSAPPLAQVLKFLWSRKSFRHMTIATALLAFGGFAAATWIPPFLIRSHGMGLGEIGTWLALLSIVSGVAGTLGGGFLGDRLAKRDIRWYVWLPAIALVIGAPLSIAGLLVQDKYLALTLLILPTASYSVYIGPVMGLIQRMVALRIRALSVAVFLFFTNLIGMGGGPLVIGYVSDLTRQWFGEDSLRYALMVIAIAVVWSSVHFVLAARTVAEDLAFASDARK
jgi:predicted MFS family arabinose efflux permease